MSPENELPENDKTSNERENAGKVDNRDTEQDENGVGLERHENLAHVEERSRVDPEEPPIDVEPPSKPSTHTEMLPDRPLQLVRPDPNKHRKLELIGQNIKHLYHIKTAVAVVAVVGKFHSGKSFLLNQLMGKTRAGFGIGPTVRPQTMGIWMWGKVCSRFCLYGKRVCMYVFTSDGGTCNSGGRQGSQKGRKDGGREELGETREQEGEERTREGDGGGGKRGSKKGRKEGGRGKEVGGGGGGGGGGGNERGRRGGKKEGGRRSRGKMREEGEGGHSYMISSKETCAYMYLTGQPTCKVRQYKVEMSLRG